MKKLIEILRGISQVPRRLAAFGPSIFALVVVYYCFWQIPQAQDLLVAYTEKPLFERIYFLFFFGFFIITLFYSSYNVTLIRQDLPPRFRDIMPPMLGYIGIILLEASVKLVPYGRGEAWSALRAFIALVPNIVLLLVVCLLLREYAGRIPSKAKVIIQNAILLVAAGVLLFSFFLTGSADQLSGLSSVLFAFEAAYFAAVCYYFFNVVPSAAPPSEEPVGRVKMFARQLRKKGANVLSILFLVLSGLGVIYYGFSIISIGLVLTIGSFCFLFLFLSIFIWSYNTAYIFGRTNGINVIAFVVVFCIVGSVIFSDDAYTVQLIERGRPDQEVYKDQPDLKEYLTNWIETRKTDIDSSKEYPLYFVLSDGGASRSAYWVASVLGKLESKTNGKFSHHLFCLSGASGGSLGNATFYSLLHLNTSEKDYVKNGQDFLKNDFLSFTLARMLGGDVLAYMSPSTIKYDRAAALERSLEYFESDSVSRMMAKPFSEFALKENPGRFPILCINTTRMQDGSPGVVATINVQKHSHMFNERINVLSLLNKGQDMKLSTAVVLGARFPFVSPAGEINNNYFVDGGYFDNSGSGFVQELIRAVRTLGKSKELQERVSKFRYYVIHVSNSPKDDIDLSPISEFNNDITSPFRTMIGAYSKQTSINDKRLIQFLEDVAPPGDTLRHYFSIPLYKDPEELSENDPYYDRRLKKEVPISMNWYISGTTLDRIKKRLENHPRLEAVAMEMKRRWER